MDWQYRCPFTEQGGEDARRQCNTPLLTLLPLAYLRHVASRDKAICHDCSCQVMSVAQHQGRLHMSPSYTACIYIRMMRGEKIDLHSYIIITILFFLGTKTHKPFTLAYR